MLNLVLASLIMAFLYGVMAMASDLLIGYSGLVVVNQAALMGVGAYTAALISLHLDWPFLPLILSTVVITGVIGVVAALPTFWLREDYFLVGSLGSQIVLISLITNWDSLTRGALGLYGLQRPAFFGYHLSSLPLYFVLVLAVLGMSWLVVYRIVSSEFGLAMRGLRADEVALEALGINIVRLKIEIMFLASAIFGFVGAAFAFYLTSVDPFSFGFHQSVLFMSMVVIGGAGNFWGTALAGMLLTLIPEALRFVGFPTVAFAEVRQIIYGLLIVLFILYRPRGLWGKYSL